MLDQVAALKWVRENVKAFSGDPGRVTVMGQQAGGASVHYHMLSPLSRGLFARAISMSGSALCWWASLKRHLEKTKKLARYKYRQRPPCIYEKRTNFWNSPNAIDFNSFLRANSKLLTAHHV